MENTSFKPCPNCLTNRYVERVFFSDLGWLGPILFSTVRCRNCGVEYNGRTGDLQDRKVIAIYIVVTTVIVLLSACALAYFVFQ